jgi:hypothetical protein
VKTKKKSYLQEITEEERSKDPAGEKDYTGDNSIRPGKEASGKSLMERTSPANSPVHLVKAEESPRIKKDPIKSTNLCNVTFRLPAEGTKEAKEVTIVGDFNEWNQKATPLKRVENGDFEVTLKLATGREYRFRYLIDGKRWENDWHADKYLKSPYGVDDSVVCV